MGKGWTLVGDMQQRHNELAAHSWQNLARDVLHLKYADSFEPVMFGRGYRSTEAILRYASRLLPVKERDVHSLQQEGPEPTVVEVASDDWWLSR